MGVHLDGNKTSDCKSESFCYRLPKHKDNVQLNEAIATIFERKKLDTSLQVTALKTLLSFSQPRNFLELAIEKIVNKACKHNSSLYPLFEDKQIPPGLLAIALEILISFKINSPLDDPRRKAARDALEEFKGISHDSAFFKNLLKEHPSGDMPDADSIGMTNEQWLDIHWEKLGKERGIPLTKEEMASNVPTKSSYKLAMTAQRENRKSPDLFEEGIL